jgi:hypothetical protein
VSLGKASLHCDAQILSKEHDTSAINKSPRFHSDFMLGRQVQVLRPMCQLLLSLTSVCCLQLSTTRLVSCMWEANTKRSILCMIHKIAFFPKTVTSAFISAKHADLTVAAPVSPQEQPPRLIIASCPMWSHQVCPLLFHPPSPLHDTRVLMIYCTHHAQHLSADVVLRCKHTCCI